MKTLRDFCVNRTFEPTDTFWICPNIVENLRITPRPFDCAMEYTNYTNIPSEILDKPLSKAWVEEEDNRKVYCLIWKNIDCLKERYDII